MQPGSSLSRYWDTPCGKAEDSSDAPLHLQHKQSDRVRIRSRPHHLDREEAQEFASVLAQEILAEMPELICKGMCIVVYDEDGNAIAHAPLGALQ
ncbi:DUF6894 family protein [Bradyrhizobium sp. BWC-3-1]|uniref:DUF6894 family protein n=1 Tax=Bradyrhizobium sp. BWC-3-1 TaxID=3080012 RepID=UPI00397B5877